MTREREMAEGGGGVLVAFAVSSYSPKQPSNILLLYLLVGRLQDSTDG